MAEFQELIKNFDRIRDYMRQFYVYGFKVRNDFSAKSARTYDNERRRIESWLSGYIDYGYTVKGKNVYINVDSKAIAQNPLYAAWKSKSFTDNDLLLHFFLMDLLSDHPEGMTARQAADQLSGAYGVVFDSQIVRLKFKEYENLGLLISRKQGKNLAYVLASPTFLEGRDGAGGLWKRLITAVQFFQGSAPFGFVGSTILDREDEVNRLFQFKHQFIVHTLEDGILFQVLEAIHSRHMIEYENKSSRSGAVTHHAAVPLKIFVSTQTGRRYVCLYHPEKRRFSNARLDSITLVKALSIYEDYETLQKALSKNLDKCWGVSFGNGQSRLEEVYVKLYIDEEKEPYILNRLYREGRGGEVLKLREHEYLYSGLFFDTNEMLSWIKTFTGRILDLQGTNSFAVAKVTYDWEKMYQMYCSGPDSL